MFMTSISPAIYPYSNFHKYTRITLKFLDVTDGYPGTNFILNDISSMLSFFYRGRQYFSVTQLLMERIISNDFLKCCTLSSIMKLICVIEEHKKCTFCRIRGVQNSYILLKSTQKNLL